jgi:thiamine kinase-like enzyme
MNSISEALTARIECLLDSKIESVVFAEGKYTQAIRVFCKTDKGKFFVKIGATPRSSKFLNREIQIYRTLNGSFMPVFVAAEEHESEPILIIEDMSSNHWPPPWDRAKVDLALEQIEAMHNTQISIDGFEKVHGPDLPSWQTVASNPEHFLSIGLADEKWLKDSLPILLDAETGCSTNGTSLCHYDLRSDNMCFAPNRAIFIDWNQACLSNPKLDLGFWLPSLAYEGGPLPQEILPDAPEIAARVSGFLASFAGLPGGAPRVRMLHRQMLEPALSWAISALGLQPIEKRGN